MLAAQDIRRVARRFLNHRVLPILPLSCSVPFIPALTPGHAGRAADAP